MNYTIYITPTAIKDIQEGKNYYNGKINILGYKFIEDIEENFKSIASHPFAFSTHYKNVRGKLLKKFPYLILYTINQRLNTIEVIR